MILLLVLVLFATPSIALATDYYVAETGSNSNSCAQAQSSSTPKLTITAGVSCLSGGDTLIITAGTYTAQQIYNPPAGTPSAYTTIKGDPAGARPVLRPTSSPAQRGFYCDNGSACAYIKVEYLEFDSPFGGVKLVGTTELGYAHHVHIINNKIHDTYDTGFFASTANTGYVGGDHLIQGNEFYQIGSQRPAYVPGTNVIYNPGSRTIIEYNTFHNNINNVGIWHKDKYLQNVIVRYNLFYDLARSNIDTWQQGALGGSAVHISVPGGGHRIHNNVVYRSGFESSFSAFRINPQFHQLNLADVQIYNNTIYNLLNASTYAIRQTKDIGGPLTVRNNIAYLAGQGISVTFAGGSESNNLTTNPSFTNTGTGDLTLASGSSAIDAGANIGTAFCGTAPDQGAFETPKVTAASIFVNLLDVTICNAAPPIVPGTFTVGCTGTGCPSTTVTNTSLLGGSGGIVRLEIGGNCNISQTYTVSSGSGTTDSAKVGNTLSQSLHTTTNFPVNSSACDGTGGGLPPASEEASYEFDGDCNDGSGNLNHATCNGTTFVTGKYGQALQTNQDEEDYADTGVLNGVNPSTTHVVIAAGIYIDPADLNDTADVWGTAIGTDQRLLVYRDTNNVWRQSVQATGGTSTEFPVTSGWTHVCQKFNATTDVATLYINGVAGTTSGASTIPITSYVLASDLRFGLPPSFSTTLSGNHKFDKAFVYTTDVSCTDLYDAWEPAAASIAAVQAAHQWQGVFFLGGVAEDRGAVDAQREIVQNGSATVQVQLNNTSGAEVNLQPRFRYNIDGGAFNNVVPDSPTSDGVAYWGTSAPSGLNTGTSDGPISGALSHTDGIVTLTSSAVPTISMANNTSYTIAATVTITAASGTVVCVKVYDQSGQPLASYTPTEGACLTVIDTQAIGGF